MSLSIEASSREALCFGSVFCFGSSPRKMPKQTWRRRKRARLLFPVFQILLPLLRLLIFAGIRSNKRFRAMSATKRAPESSNEQEDGVRSSASTSKSGSSFPLQIEATEEPTSFSGPRDNFEKETGTGRREKGPALDVIPDDTGPRYDGAKWGQPAEGSRFGVGQRPVSGTALQSQMQNI